MMMPPIDPINILAKNGIAAIFFNKMSPVQYIHRSEKLGLWSFELYLSILPDYTFW